MNSIEVKRRKLIKYLNTLKFKELKILKFKRSKIRETKRIR